MTTKAYKMATLAGGCFWCTEAIFQRLKGVSSVVPGYAGGAIDNPTYEQVCSGTSGHTEAIQITFDSKVISFEKLLEVFWHLHDPTTPNRQGKDVGPQYRSVIFYHDQKQKEIAKKTKAQIEKSGLYPGKIVTEIIPYTNFYQAENYHLNYYDQNRLAPLGPQSSLTRQGPHGSVYCQLIIDPKIKKLQEEFKKEVK